MPFSCKYSYFCLLLQVLNVENISLVSNKNGRVKNLIK